MRRDEVWLALAAVAMYVAAALYVFGVVGSEEVLVFSLFANFCLVLAYSSLEEKCKETEERGG